MKQTKILFTALLAVVCLTACGGGGAKQEKSYDELKERNHKTVEQLGKIGDQPHLEREVFHTIHFSGEKDANAFIKEAEKLGFTSEMHYSQGVGEFHVFLTRRDNILPENLDEYTVTLARMAEEHRGEYHSWGAGAVKAVEPDESPEADGQAEEGASEPAKSTPDAASGATMQES